MAIQEPEFREMLSALVREKVEFLLIGGHALGIHGITRATRDIDFWVKPDPENAKAVWRAMAEFGAPMDLYEPDDLARPGMVLQIGVPPLRIDVCTSIEGVGFESAWSNRTEHTVGDITFPVIGLDDLIRNKEATGRDKDMVDARALRKLRGK